MVKDYDKPEYIDVKRNAIGDNEKRDSAIKLMKEILSSQSFGVLATNGDNECYTSLISFACGADFTTLAFATPVETKKFNMIKKNNGVSILIDNRSNNENSINDIAAVTCIGLAKVLKEKEEVEKWSKVLINKHSYLDDFINADTTAIVLVEISKYYYVTSFQEVLEWSPK
ncbi:MAG: pyridoxamine 5'-phosphate oxidase family protein [Gudongella sp.]|nr:pyridoxamine 5'-phosphate oxidase family protein [Gudongella sp.]